MRLTLVVRPDGKAVLAVPAEVTERMAQAIRDAWNEWSRTPEAQVLIVPDCEVVQVHDIDLEVKA